MFDKLFGAWIALLAVLGLAWLGFMGWAIYTVVEWGTHK